MCLAWNKAKHRYSIKFDHFYFKSTLTVIITTATREPKPVYEPPLSSIVFDVRIHGRRFHFGAMSNKTRKFITNVRVVPIFVHFDTARRDIHFRDGVSHDRIFVRARSFIIRNTSRVGIIARRPFRAFVTAHAFRLSARRNERTFDSRATHFFHRVRESVKSTPPVKIRSLGGHSRAFRDGKIGNSEQTHGDAVGDGHYVQRRSSSSRAKAPPFRLFRDATKLVKLAACDSARVSQFHCRIFTLVASANVRPPTRNIHRAKLDIGINSHRR